jgi:N-acetylneuraminic acid mutarotase
VKKKSKISGYILRGTVAALLLSCVTIGLSSAINVTNDTPEASASEHNTAFGVNAHEGAASAEASAIQRTSTLTFEERVPYQRAIEEVYWHHRLWPKERPDPKPPLDAVMSQEQLENKVADYLRNSQTLEDYWRQPITAEQLQTEMDRMAQHTKQPEILRELFAALGNDPLVIAECLARPVLAERLLTELNERDRVKKVAAIDSIAKAVQVNRPYQLPVIASPSGGCTDDTWTPTSTTNAPAGRDFHTAVWTGSEMIVWGGGLNTGGRYNPSTDSWTATSTTNAPSARYAPAVWTGSEMIVWGGDNFSGYLDTGGRYNPSTDSWTATSTTNAPEARVQHTAVWTGNEMIVWGGFNPDAGETNTGGRYNPSMDSWTPTSTTNAPSGRNLHTAVWTGSEMIVWGGLADNSGGRYNPVTDNWVSTSTTNAPTARIQHTAVWTGSEMIVWGGFSPSGGTYFNTGGKYSPATDSWTPTSTTNAPSARYIHTAVWTGSEMTIWGGGGVSGNVDTGGRYDPATDGWAPTSTINAPSARTHHTAVWTGSEMIVWGGVGNGFPFPYFNTGGRYCAPGPPARLGNVSTRAFVETGDNVTIGGFIVQGTQPKRVIIRAIGPELTQYGVPDPLANPTLELHDGTEALIASNNNWGTTIIGGIITANQVQDIRNSGYAPGDELESAIIADLAPGNYTAIMRGVNNMTGVGLVEVYNLSPDTDSILGNISTRAFVQTGDNVMIGGFIVRGTQPKHVIIRAIGPELTQNGVPNVLANPTLELHDGSEALIASNDNWRTTIIGGIITSDQVSEIRVSGHAPGDGRESAIIANLPPGNYTAIVRGVNNTTGVALVEVYDLD